MSRATEAHERFSLAMTEVDPECQGDDRFISDGQPAESLAPICRRCPLFDLCAEYARLERPKAGIWAGNRYRTNSMKESN